MIINRIYEHQNIVLLLLVSFLVGLRTYQHPSTYQSSSSTIQTYVRKFNPAVYVKHKWASGCAERNTILSFLINHTIFIA
jgi:hypothetical protein